MMQPRCPETCHDPIAARVEAYSTEPRPVEGFSARLDATWLRVRGAARFLRTHRYRPVAEAPRALRRAPVLGGRGGARPPGAQAGRSGARALGIRLRRGRRGGRSGR